MSTNINDPSTVYLLDEGLELWLVVVQYAPSANEALIALCDNLMPIIGMFCLSWKFLLASFLNFSPNSLFSLL
jgi:hypothetical protein